MSEGERAAQETAAALSIVQAARIFQEALNRGAELGLTSEAKIETCYADDRSAPYAYNVGVRVVKTLGEK